MNRLFAANFFRLKKNGFFWIGVAFMGLTGVLFPVMRYLDMKETGGNNTLDEGFFSCAVFIGILSSIFISLFIGTEYGDGTIRNKIIVGQKRSSIYLANLLVCSLVGIAYCAIFFAVYLGVGIPLLGFFATRIQTVLLLVITVFLLSLAFSGLFTMIASLEQNKALTVLFCVLLAFLLLIAGTYINARLSEPETYPAVYMTEEGTTATDVENPNYLEGNERKIYQFFYNFLPGGQAIQCTSMEMSNPSLLWTYSLIILIVSTGVGLFFLQRKDLK